MTRILTTLIAAALLCLGLAAQQQTSADRKKSGASAMPAPPKPAPEMTELLLMAGTWSTEEKFEPSIIMPSGGESTGTSRVRRGPGGLSVTMDQTSKSAMGTFTGHGVLTWDAEQKVYKMSWVDSMTPGMMFETGRKEGNDIIMTGEMMMGGKKLTVRDVISNRTPTSYTLTSYLNDGSGEKKFGTIKFTKQEAPAAKK
jgi:hypothetical protein